MVSKNAEFDADFESVMKIARKKSPAKKVFNKKFTEKWSFYTFLMSATVFGL